MNFFMTLMKLRYEFFFPDLSQHFLNRLGGLCTEAFYSCVRGDVKSSVSKDEMLYNHNPNTKLEILKN